MKKYLIISVLMIASLYFFIPIRNERCFWQSEFDNKRIYGVVIRKFIDSSQHSTPILEIKDLKRNVVDTISFLGEQSGIYKELNKLDTIFKNPNSSQIFFLEQKKYKLLGSVDFGCTK